VGPCAYCGAPSPFAFNPRLARLSAKAVTIWACPAHRADLPEKGQGGHEMDELTDFLDDESVDLKAAAAAMARFWKSQGLGDAVAAIGQNQGYQGAKFLLGTYFATRAKRLAKESAKAKRNAAPF
jgi:hypothetical protein